MRAGIFSRYATLSIAIISLATCATNPNISAEEEGLTQLSNEQKTTLLNWLSQHPDFRIATEADCDCAEDIQQMRSQGSWGVPVPGYEPFILIGDFNKDGAPDFAILTEEDASKGVTLLIFNGPFTGETRKNPSYVKRLDRSDTKHIGLFLTYEEHWPIIGPFESEGCIYKPKGNSYEEDCGDF